MKKSFLIGISLIIIGYTIVPTHTFAQATTTVSFQNATAVEARVRTYFADLPVMINIAKCESGFRQFADSGNVFAGGLGGTMIGIFQISKNVHQAFALSIGMDINTVEGNMQYSRYLYQHSGTDPWISSIKCWNINPIIEGGIATTTPISTQVSPQPTTVIPNTTLTLNLTFGTDNQQVLVLQQLLNKAGFTIAQSGPGSPGNETTKFGSLTRVAVRAFQCAQNIVCQGDEYTTAYGLVGPTTRKMLLQIPPSSTSTAEQLRITNIKSKILELQKQISALQAQLP